MEDSPKTRLANMVALALVKLITDDGSRQTAQVDPGTIEEPDPIDEVDVLQPYGFASSPPTESDAEGSQALVIFLGANRSEPLVIMVDASGGRPTLAPGDTAMWTKADGEDAAEEDGHRVHLVAEGRKILIRGLDIQLGSDAAGALATKSDLDALKAKFDAWTPVAMDGGAALKTQLAGWTPTGTTKVRGE